MHIIAGAAAQAANSLIKSKNSETEIGFAVSYIPELSLTNGMHSFAQVAKSETKISRKKSDQVAHTEDGQIH
jgi:hypothetical protein